jgi:hypothetical protein
MLRKIMITLAALTFVGAMAASTTADARRGGGFHGGGFRGAAFHGGGFRGGAFHGGGFRGGAFHGGGFRGSLVGSGFRGGFVGPRHFAFRHGFGPRFHRFHRHRFGFAAVPFVVGAGFYGASCWRWRPTPWGWQRVWVCGYDYGYYGYY